MTKANYINEQGGEIKQFEEGKQPEGWVYLPPMKRYIDTDGKFHLRVEIEGAVIDISESEVPREVLAQEGEVVEDGEKQSVEPSPK